jgi:simple sugar transport system substrate-binding protein
MKMEKNISKFLTVSVILVFTLFFVACQHADERKNRSIAVFIPGVVSGSPLYELLATGVTDAVDTYNKTLSGNENDKDSSGSVKVSIMEAGTNQAEWGSKLTALAASGAYDVIISSNPSLPELIAPLTITFPAQKFIILDSEYAGNMSIATVRYNQREQGYLAGYAAGLVTGSDMPYANSQKKIALVAAQEYPVMNDIIYPAFIEGAQAVDPAITVEFRIVGNWYDASKAAEIARSLYQGGVDVILPIAGGASQGILSAARELGFYVSWFDDNGFEKAPGYVISSSVLRQDKLAHEVTQEFLEGKIQYGTACIYGASEGYVALIQDDPSFISTVSPEIRDQLATVYTNICTGVLQLPSP